MAVSDTPLLEVENLVKDFDVSRPWLNRVIEGAPRMLRRARGFAPAPTTPTPSGSCRWAVVPALNTARA